MASVTAVLAGVPVLFLLRQLWRFGRGPLRFNKVSQIDERILILGGGTGVGRETAQQYLARGARVCIVGRRKDKLDEVMNDCSESGSRLVSYVADIASVDDMIALRKMLVKEWNGIDTIVLSAGVSALQPILGTAGIENPDRATILPDIDKNGIEAALTMAEAATRINYYGPLIVATTFIPLLTRSSKSPSILLVSSLAATVPSPTRGLYGSTKAASLVLYQAMAAEHPSVSISCILPTTIEGTFRSSAVDQGHVREADPNVHGLKVQAVARRCIEAVDNQEKTLVMPGWEGIAPFLYYIWPSLITAIVKKKYNYYATV